MLTKADVIIIGAGSAGCVLAERLSQDPNKRVLVLEAGPRGRTPTISVPAGYAFNFNNARYNYCYRSEPEPSLGNQRVYQPRGKGVGGSGAINAMIYMRGARNDFEDWAVNSSSRWSYEAVLPYFRRLERHYSANVAQHGRNGRIGICTTETSAPDLCHTFFGSCSEAGLLFNHDFNDGHLNGYGFYDMNVRGGLRSSSAREYLAPTLKRGNLRLLTRAKVRRILLKGTRAVGVEVQHRGRCLRLKARDQVILCAGAVDTPKLLQLSGIGDAQALGGHGISSIVDNPNVGQNLQDHLSGSLFYRSRQPTLNMSLGSFWGKMQAGWRYITQRQGPLAFGAKHSGAFLPLTGINSNAKAQVYFNPIAYTLPETPNARLSLHKQAGISLFFNVCRPHSQGSITIQSANPDDAPLIRNRYLSHPQDRIELLEAFRQTRQLATIGPLKDILVDHRGYANMKSDEDILKELTASCGSIYHLCGSCAMGNDPEFSVVDEHLNVHGTKGLKIVDASVFPNITSSNTQAPTLMVAEVAADIIHQTWSC